jgi:hypothetical protein
MPVIKDSASDAKRFVEEFDVTYQIVRALDESLIRGFGVRGLPETFFVDHHWRSWGRSRVLGAASSRARPCSGATIEAEFVTNVERLIRRAATQ